MEGLPFLNLQKDFLIWKPSLKKASEDNCFLKKVVCTKITGSWYMKVSGTSTWMRVLGCDTIPVKCLFGGEFGSVLFLAGEHQNLSQPETIDRSNTASRPSPTAANIQFTFSRQVYGTPRNSFYAHGPIHFTWIKPGNLHSINFFTITHIYLQACSILLQV